MPERGDLINRSNILKSLLLLAIIGLLVVLFGGSNLLPSVKPSPVDPTPEALRQPSSTATPSPFPTPTFDGTPRVTGVRRSGWNTSPLPAGLERISRGNAGELRKLSQWGRGNLTDVAFSPKGDSIAVLSTAAVYIMDAQTLDQEMVLSTEGGELYDPSFGSVERFHNKSGERIQFSPNGERLAYITWDGKTSIWNTSDWTHCWSLENTSNFAFSPDGKRIAAIPVQHDQIYIWNIDDKSLFKIIPIAAEVVEFSPDGSSLAFTAYNPERVYLYNFVEDTYRVKEISTYTYIDLLAFNPNGTLLAIGWIIISLSDMKTYLEIPKLASSGNNIIIGPFGSIGESISFSPDGKKLFFPNDGNIYSEDIKNKVVLDEKFQVFDPKGDHDAFFRFSFSPDGQTIATCSSDNAIRLWRVSDGALLAERVDFTEPTRDVAFSLDGKYIAAANYIWNFPSGEQKMELTGDFKASHVFSTDGKYLITNENSKLVNIYQVDNGSWLKKLYIDFWGVGLSTFFINGEMITLDHLGNIYFIDTDKILRSKSDCITVSALSKDNLEGSGCAGEISEYLSLRKILPDPFKEKFYDSYDIPIEDADVSMDGKMIAIGGYDYAVVINRYNAEIIGIIDWESIDSSLWSIRISPNKQVLATGHDDGNIRLWRMSDGTLMRTLEGHKATVREIAYSTDGNLILSASEDQTVILWDARDGSILKTLINAGDYATFSPDGKMIVTSSRAGVIRFYGVETKNE